MKYLGFREETLLDAVHRLEALEMRPSEVHAIMNLAGAKWRSVQVREGRGNELQSQEDSRVFHDATVAIMQTMMSENQKLAALGHTEDGERFMLLAISVAMSELFARGPKSIRKWIGRGEAEARKVILSFAMGSSIVMEPQAIDYLMPRIVKFRYGVHFEQDKDISDAVIAVIEGLGNSGNSCLNPIADAMK
jgi:hypothetical protein